MWSKKGLRPGVGRGTLWTNFMQIFWHGMSSVRIEAKQGDREATLLTDPYFNETGLRFTRTAEPDILVLSHQDRKRFNLEGVGGTPFIIADPGEYEVKGIFVRSIQDPTVGTEAQRPMVYRFDAEGMSVGFIGELKRQLTAEEVEAMGDIDILLIPVGGGSVLDSKQATEMINTIEPRIVVPLYFDLPGLKESLGGVETFCKQMVCTRQDAAKLKIAKKDLPVEDMQVVVLERA